MGILTTPNDGLLCSLWFMIFKFFMFSCRPCYYSMGPSVPNVKNTVFLRRQNQSRQEILMCIYASNNFDLLFFIENKWVNDHFAMVAEYVATKSIKIEPAAIIWLIILIENIWVNKLKNINEICKLILTF